MPVNIVLIAYFLGQKMIDLDTTASDCPRIFSSPILRVCSLLLVGHSPAASSLDSQVVTRLKTDSMLDRLLSTFCRSQAADLFEFRHYLCASTVLIVRAFILIIIWVIA